MTKSTITRAAAIALAIEVLEHAKSEDWDTAPIAEAQEVLKNMHAQLMKPRAKAVSKARKMNENLAREVAKRIPAEGVTSKQIVGFGLPEITTTQKAAAVMRVAEELGLIIKVKDGKAVIYKPVEDAEDIAE